MIGKNISIPILLLDMPFEPGKCLETIARIKNPDARNLALTEYDYYTCHHEQAAGRAAAYLECTDVKIKIGAGLVYIYANLALGNAKEVRQEIRYLKRLASNRDEFARESGIPLMLCVAKFMLHIPITEAERREIEEDSWNCNEGGRLLCCYLLEQKNWRNQKHERIIGAVETALHMTKDAYPLITLYFYLAASESAMHLKDMERAEAYFKKAWELVKADGFLGPVGEMHGHLQIFLEKRVKERDPEAYRRIMQVTHEDRIGWKKLICGETLSEEELKMSERQETLTGMEYAVALLAGLEWSNQEIGDYFDISVRTVKYYITTIFNKLGINSRREIAAMLFR